MKNATAANGWLPPARDFEQRKRGIRGVREQVDDGIPIDQKGFEFGMEIVNYRSSGHRASDHERASKRSINILLDLKGDTRRCSSHLIYRFFLIHIKNAIKNKEQDGYGILSRYFDRIKMKRDGNLILNGIVITGVEAGSGRK